MQNDIYNSNSLNNKENIKKRMNIASTNEYKAKYIENNYERFLVTVKKGRKSELQIHIKQYGYKSLNNFINIAINEKIERDISQSVNNKQVND